MSTVDVLIYVHPELSAEARKKMVNEVTAFAGVVSAKFDKHKHPHALTVMYNSNEVQSKQILDLVKKHDPAASLVGL